MYQGGCGLSSAVEPRIPAVVPQTQEDIHAWAVNARLDHLRGDANNTRYSLELLIASGDDDRLTSNSAFGGNLTGSSDTAFNAWGLVNTGLAFGGELSNLVMVRAGPRRSRWRSRRGRAATPTTGWR